MLDNSQNPSLPSLNNDRMDLLVYNFSVLKEIINQIESKLKETSFKKTYPSRSDAEKGLNNDIGRCINIYAEYLSEIVNKMNVLIMTLSDPQSEINIQNIPNDKDYQSLIKEENETTERNIPVFDSGKLVKIESVEVKKVIYCISSDEIISEVSKNLRSYVIETQKMIMDTIAKK